MLPHYAQNRLAMTSRVYFTFKETTHFLDESTSYNCPAGIISSPVSVCMPSQAPLHTMDGTFSPQDGDASAPLQPGRKPPEPGAEKRKRRRIVISCEECHRRKQRCDRGLPCSNCKLRGVGDICQYSNPGARTAQLAAEQAGAQSEPERPPKLPKIADAAAEVSGFGYATSNGNTNTTLGIFNKIENYGKFGQNTTSRIEYGAPHIDYTALRDKYKGQVRLLPPKVYIDKLLDTYFHEVNYHYYPLDEGIFRDLYRDWLNVSHATLNKGPQELSDDLKFFPGLLFQILALALQFQPPEYDQMLDGVKYAAGMSFDDVARDYSESGLSILTLLGVRSTSLVKVQAGFLRTSYLKNCGLVPESWHSLSSTIRDAQEIDLHKPGVHRPDPNGSPEDSIEHLWQEQLRIRMWSILALWDIHMSIVLGRPSTINSGSAPRLPDDNIIPKNRKLVVPSLRSDSYVFLLLCIISKSSDDMKEKRYSARMCSPSAFISSLLFTIEPQLTNSDPPTPLTMIRWSVEVAAPLWTIAKLERDDPQHSNISTVMELHKLAKSIDRHCPRWFRSVDPDLTFDTRPECWWLPRARATFQNGAAFAIMALHRPYIWTNANCRTEALKASLDILRAQRTLFTLLNSNDYKIFSLVLNTFDAVIIITAIYILHPFENQDNIGEALQHYDWAMERFQVMSERNDLAKAAHRVLHNLKVRLNEALATSKSIITHMNNSSSSIFSPQTSGHGSYTDNMNHDSTRASLSSASSSANDMQYPRPGSVLNGSSGGTSSWENDFGTIMQASQAAQAYENNHSLVPLQPLRDLISGLSTSSGEMIDPQLMDFQNANSFQQFQGVFDEHSFWGHMNHPSTYAMTTQ